MESVVNKLRKDAQLAVFLQDDCNPTQLASEVIALDSKAQHGHSSASGSSHELFPKSSSLTNALHSSNSTKSTSRSEEFLMQINDMVSEIDGAITHHVTNNHTSLLSHVGSVDGLQTHANLLHGNVHKLHHSIEDMELSLAKQRDHLHKLIQKHRRVEQTSELIRRLVRFHQLSEKVDQAMAQCGFGTSSASSSSSLKSLPSELNSVAQAIREIDLLASDPRFDQLSPVQTRLPMIRKFAQAVRREMRARLKKQVEELNQTEMASCLQVLLYLNSLSESVETIVNDVIQEIERKTTTSLAEENLVSRSSHPNSPERLPQQADVWRAIQNVFESLRVHAMQIWNLQRVLTKMVDTGSGRKYIDFIITQQDEPSLFSTFWEVTCAILRELLTGTLEYSSAVKNMLIASVPRMRQEAHRVLQELHASTSISGSTTKTTASSSSSSSSLSASTSRRLTASSSKLMKGDEIPAIGSSTHEQNQLLECMSSLVENFLDRCLRRLSSPINMMFPQSAGFHPSPPSRNDMLTLIRSMETELDQAHAQDCVLVHGILTQLVSGIELFCNHVNRIMHTGKQAVQTSPTLARTTYQAHNMNLVSVLHQLDEAITDIFQRVRRNALSSAGVGSGGSSSKVFVEDQALEAKIDQSLIEMQRGCHKAVRQLEYSILGPYLQALAGLLENILAKMHDESFATLNEPLSSSNSTSGMSSTSTSTASSCSRYMTEFSTIFTTIQDEHLKRLVNAPFVNHAVEDFAARLICVFLRHAALLRPLHEQGKLRLATDMAQLELRLESVVSRCSSSLRNLGACYEELRAFRHMMFLENSALLRDPMVDAIRPSNVWHHLLARGPLELQLPHQMKKIPAAKYVEWLETMACGTDNNSAFPLSEIPLGYPCLKRPELALVAEQTAWKEVLKCLDFYAQRISANKSSNGTTCSVTKEQEVYQLVMDSGATLLAGYEMNFTKKDKV